MSNLIVVVYCHFYLPFVAFGWRIGFDVVMLVYFVLVVWSSLFQLPKIELTYIVTYSCLCTSSALRSNPAKAYIKFIMNPEAATENGDTSSLNEILNFKGTAEGTPFNIFQYLKFLVFSVLSLCNPTIRKLLYSILTM